MNKNLLSYLSIANCLILFFFLLSCGGNSVDTKSDLAKDFNKSHSIPALKASILTIPENITLVSAASSGKKSKNTKINKNMKSTSLVDNMYGSVTSTIKFSDEIKNNITEFLEFIFTEQNLASAEVGTRIETEEGVITAYMIEDISQVEGEKFKWKLSLYFRFSIEPNIICRFTFQDGKMKGQMLQSGYDSTTVMVGDFPHTYFVYYYYDIRFDGTTVPQKLDVDYVFDLSQMIRFAEQYWRQLTDEQKESLDLGQTGSASIRVQFDGVEYGISGANYAPGDNALSNLERYIKIFGEDHSTYSFRAKSITGTVDGAKMEVALPADELEDIEAMWENDCFSVLYEKVILGFLEEYLTQLLDTIDDEYLNNADYLGTSILKSVDFDGTPLEEQRIAIDVLYLYLGNQIAIPNLAEHGNTITTEEFDAAVDFWGSGTFTNFGLTSLSEINAFLSSTDVTITDANKEEVYYRVMAPTIVAYYQTNPSGITLDQVEDVLESINDFYSLQFKELIETNRLIVNPAFFEKETGLLGTFDGTNFNTYDWYDDILEVGTKPTNFDDLNALDLTELEAVIPKSVKDLVIEVK